MSLLKLTTLVTLSLGAALGANATPLRRDDYVLKERHLPPRAWKRVAPADQDHLVNLQFGLKQPGQDLVERHLLETSNPKSKRYGQHLSADEIRDLVTPESETLALVEAWLKEHDVTKIGYSPAKDWISVVVPLSEAEELLQTKYSVYRHDDGDELTRATEWSLPQHLHDHIEVVQPTTSFLRMQPRARIWVGEDAAPKRPDAQVDHVGALAAGLVDVGDICDVNVTTPDCLRTLYGTIDYTVQAADRNAVGICNYLNETNNRNDAEVFLEEYRPDAVEAAREFQIQTIDGAPNPQGPYTPEMLEAGTNIEGNLDAQLVLAISWPTPMTAFSTGGSPPFIPDLNTPTNTNEPYMAFLNTVLAQADGSLPRVISTSYGDDEQTIPESYARRACRGFAQLGARGISVLFSSGDAGVGSDGTCVTNDGRNTTQFLPAFPAGCPWVTAVGATANFMPETAVTRYASGAGFSNYFPAPEYQVDTVDAYVESLDGMYDGLYNKSGRAYPDVSAQGNNDAIAWNATLRTVGGTSASCPTLAGIVALLNDARIAEGKPSLGFLNPWIYGAAQGAWTDVTVGSSYGCDTEGFPAQEGWDAVTGFGTPNFKKLLDLALNSYPTDN